MKILVYICRKFDTMIEDFRLQVFDAVARERSFTKAAAALGISQPAVSQNIAELEKLVGMKLFERLRGEVVMTPEGTVFKDYADRIMDLCSSTHDMFTKLSPATVRISVSEELYNYYILPALESFSKVHPEIIFEKALFDDADLKVMLRPADPSLQMQEDAISRIRMSVSTPLSGSHPYGVSEKTSYFDVIFEPSPSFSCTRLYRLIREFVIS